MTRILTWGYSGSTPEDLAAYQRATGALVVDVRLSPRSRVHHWMGDALRRLLGTAYLHVPSLGNVNYRDGGEIKLADPRLGLFQLTPKLAHTPLILVCACADVDTCHRKVAAEFLARETGATVEHLPARFADWTGGGTAPTPPARDPRSALQHRDGALRALSLTQPWAALMGAGKLVETRSWATSYRGELAIHAAKGFPGAAIAECHERPFNAALRAAGYVTPADLPRGAIVAVGRLVDCRKTTDAEVQRVWAPPGSDERAFGDYTPGRFAVRFEDVRRLPQPVSCRGFLSLWDVPADVEAEVRRQLREGVAA